MQWAWRHYYAPLHETQMAVADWPRTALFLAGDGGLPYARAIHYLTGCKLLLPEHWDRFQHVLRHATGPLYTDDAWSRCPSLRGLEVEYHASRRLGVVVEASGLTTEKCTRLLREFTKGGYDCHLVRIQRDANEQVDADLDPLFPRQRYVMETDHPKEQPWLRLLDADLRLLIERVRRTYKGNRTAYVAEDGTDALPLWEEAEPGLPLDEASMFTATSTQRRLYTQWLKVANMTADDILKFLLTFAGKYISKKARKSVLGGVDYNADALRWVMELRDNPMEDWTPTHWRWARKQVLTIKKLKRLKMPLRINAQPTSKLLQMQVWGHNPRVKKSPPHEFETPDEPETK